MKHTRNYGIPKAMSQTKVTSPRGVGKPKREWRAGEPALIYSDKPVMRAASLYIDYDAKTALAWLKSISRGALLPLVLARTQYLERCAKRLAYAG